MIRASVAVLDDAAGARAAGDALAAAALPLFQRRQAPLGFPSEGAKLRLDAIDARLEVAESTLDSVEAGVDLGFESLDPVFKPLDPAFKPLDAGLRRTDLDGKHVKQAQNLW
jgi:hypothetical protein